MEATTTIELVLAAAKNCPDAKEVLKILFPVAFADNWQIGNKAIIPGLVDDKQQYILVRMNERYAFINTDTGRSACGHFGNISDLINKVSRYGLKKI